MRRGVWLVLALLLAIPSAALAGGWSVVTLDSTPENVRANTPFTIGFMVLQHGKTPMADLSPTILFTRANGSARSGGVTLVKGGGPETVTFTARPDGATGHYSATIELPAAGRWEWQIDAFGPIAQMSPIEVIAAAAEQNPASVAPEAAQQPVLWWIGGVALLVALAFGALLMIRQGRRERVHA